MGFTTVVIMIRIVFGVNMASSFVNPSLMQIKRHRDASYNQQKRGLENKFSLHDI